MVDNLIPTPTPIAVGIDGSQGALSAARWAARHAVLAGVPVRLVHAVVVPDWLGSLVSSPVSHSDNLTHEMRVRGGHLLAAASAAAQQSAPGVIVDTRLAHGAVADVLETESRDARAVVIGFRPIGLAREVMMRSNVIHIVNGSHCPIILHRSGTSDMLDTGTVIIGVDGSDNSDSALVAAMELADTQGRSVIAVHTYRVSRLELIEFNSGFLDWDRFHARREQWLVEHVRPIREKFPNVEVAVVCRDAEPAGTLMSLAQPDDLIVVGARGLNRLAGLIMGSVSQNLVYETQCSLMIVR